MVALRFLAKITIILLCSLLLATVINCGDKVTDPGGGSGGGDDTTGLDPDVTPPQTITDPSLTYSLEEKTAYLSWSAPWDDSLTEAVSRYMIRFTYTNPFIWDLSIPVMDPPNPSMPGELQQYAIRYPMRGKNLYSAIRSVDENGNSSAISPIAMVHIPGYSVSGRCLRAFDRLPVEGLAIELATGGIHLISSAADGGYMLSDLTAGAASIRITTGSAGFPCHTMQEHFELESDMQRTDYIIPVRATESPLFDNFLSFFKALTESNKSSSTVIKTWKHRPVKCYIPALVSIYGIDYEFEVHRAAQRWMDRSGVTLFTFVDEPPDTGITFHFKSRSQMGIQIGITRHTPGSDGHPMRDDIDIVDDCSLADRLYRIAMHELGHTIHFGHLPYQEFIMYAGGNLPPDISNDEADAVKLLVSLPTTIDMAIYDEQAP